MPRLRAALHQPEEVGSPWAVAVDRLLLRTLSPGCNAYPALRAPEQLTGAAGTLSGWITPLRLSWNQRSSCAAPNSAG